MLLEHAELKVALALSRSDGLTFINESTKDSLIPDTVNVPELVARRPDKTME